MIRRFTAVLLALMMLVSVLPANAGAEVYKIGDQIWITGAAEKPTGETEPGSKWAPVVTADGVWQSRPGQCPKQEHSHKTSCYDTQGTLVCTLEKHKHGPICNIKYAEYLWEVVSDGSGAIIPEPTDPPATEPGQDDYEEGTASFSVRNLDARDSEKPLVGAEFLLLEPRTEGNDVVQGHVYTDENGEAFFGGLALEDGENSATWYLVQNMAPENALSNHYRPNTDKWNVSIVRNGEDSFTVESIVLDGAEEETEEAESTEPAEEATENTEPEESTPPADGEEEGSEEIAPVQGYDPVTRTLTVLNEPLLGSLLINAEFEGLAAGDFPEEMTTSAKVSGPNGYEKTVAFPVDKVGFSPWQDELIDLTMGDYSIVSAEPSQIEGYTMEETVIEVQLPEEEPAVGASVTLSKNASYATFIITYRYTANEPTDTTNPSESTEPTDPAESTDPSESTEPTNPTESTESTDPTDPTEATEPTEVTEPTEETNPTESTEPTGSSEPVVEPDEHTNELLIRVVDESGNEVDGTTIAMGDKNYSNGDVIDLEALAEEGKNVTYSLKQTKAAAGYNLATEEYTVKISKEDGEVEVKVTDEGQSFLERVFSGSSIPYGPNGEWLLTFTNERKTAQIKLTCRVTVNFGAGCWEDASLKKKYLEDTEYEFLLTWEDDNGKDQDSIKLANGQSGVFEMQVPYGVEYEITPVNEKGYFASTFTEGAKKATIGISELQAENRVAVMNTYTIEPGAALELNMVKVDATTEEPMQDVSFTLLDSDGDELATYKSGEEGEINIVGVLNAGGVYALKETETHEGYEILSDPVSITVSADYSLKKAGGTPALKQKLTAAVSSKAVEKQTDGTYLVKNYKTGEGPSGSNPKTGDSFDIVLWSGAMAVSTMGLVLMAAGMEKKKRRVR